MDDKRFTMGVLDMADAARFLERGSFDLPSLGAGIRPGETTAPCHPGSNPQGASTFYRGRRSLLLTELSVKPVSSQPRSGQLLTGSQQSLDVSMCW